MSVSVKSLAAPSWPLFVLAPVVCAIALALLFAEGLAEMAGIWFSREEYSHGVLIPAIAAYLAWRQRDVLLSRPLTPAPSGIVVMVVAVLLNLLGKLGAVFALQQYAFVLALYGVAATLTGWRGVRALWAPLLVLVFMVPLPNFLLNNLSSQLQLMSSQLGVWFIRLFDISRVRRRQRHRPRRLQAAGRRGLRRPALPVSAADDELHHGLPVQGGDVEARACCSCPRSR